MRDQEFVNNGNQMKKTVENSTKNLCKFCHEMISETNLAEHERICSMNAKHVIKISNVYQCNLCSTERKSRQTIFKHIYQECWQNIPMSDVNDEIPHQFQKNDKKISEDSGKSANNETKKTIGKSNS